MILEVAMLNVRAGQSAAFERAFAQAEPIIRHSQGYISHQLQRCLESPDKYILLVNWNRLEDHTVGFRQSAQYQEWRRLLHHFYDPFPTVEHFEALLKDGARVLTHCNAGALATAGWGTALGVFRSAVEAGKKISVIADETRPFLQGARLTAWEMVQENIPVTLITDNMSGHLMAHGEIDAVVVGTDRVAANGDVANKIGTYMVAVLARRHNIPFYVACPLSTIDMNIATGADIPIEERSVEEVKGFRDYHWAAEGVKIRNPAFDVTPAELVTGLITEKGVVLQPDVQGIRKLFG